MNKKGNEKKTFDIDEGVPYLMEKFDVRLQKIENIISDVNVFQTGIQKKLDLQNSQINSCRQNQGEQEQLIFTLQQQFRDLQTQYSKKIDSHTRDIQYHQKQIQDNLKDTKDLLKVQKNYATLKQLTEVKDFISKDLVVKDDYNEFKSVTEKAVFEINSDIGTIQSNIYKLKKKSVEKIQDLNIQTEKLRHTDLEHNDRLIALFNNLSKCQKDCDLFRLQIDELFNVKETKQTVQILTNRFNVFSDVETVQQMRDVFLPKIKSFLGLIDQMEDSHRTMRECIRKFDEDISIKANKGDLLLLQQKLELNYITNDYKNDVRKYLASQDIKIGESQNEIQRQLENQQNNIKSIIGEMISDFMKNKLMQYEKVVNSFKKFFDQEEIGALIDRKADIELLSHLEEKKANVKDISTLHSLFLRLDEKMKYLSVLQAEMAHSIVPQKKGGNFKNQEDLNNTLERRQKLLDHANILCGWIYKSPLSDNKQYNFSILKNQIQQNLIKNGSSKQKNISQKDIQKALQQMKSIENLSGTSLGSQKETIGRDPTLISGSTSKFRDQTLKFLQKINSQENNNHITQMSNQSPLSSNSQNLQILVQNMNKSTNNQVLGELSNSDFNFSNAPEQLIKLEKDFLNKTGDQKSQLFQKQNFKQIQLKIKSQQQKRFDNISQLAQNVAVTPQNNIFKSLNNEKNDKIQNITMEQSKISYNNEQDTTTRKKDENDFVKFVDNIKIQRHKHNATITGHVMSKRAPTEESFEITPINSASLHPRLLNRNQNTKSQANKQNIPHNSIDFQTLVSLSKEIQQKNQNDNLMKQFMQSDDASRQMFNKFNNREYMRERVLSLGQLDKQINNQQSFNAFDKDQINCIDFNTGSKKYQ